MPSAFRLCLPVLAAVLLGTGCAAGDGNQAAPVTPSVAQTLPALPIEVRIAAGVVTPADIRLEARIGQPIELVVDSDTADELHVHAAPEHTFAITPGTNQRFAFTVDVPGRVEIELHGAGRTVATLLVRG
ncbi:hypothetical protein [Nocardia sp. X0981]